MSAIKNAVSASCPECAIGPFTRNHYFTGKLLVERDFREEQSYYIDKLRLHEQRLHGWGVVCGLKVTQADSEACRNRFVCIEPGLAIDCCGHEIYVAEKDCTWDLTQTAGIKALVKNNDKDTHTLQICIRYKECPSEPIPVLYDDCGCDDTQCAPNRILEAYEIDVNVDPKSTATSPDAPVLAWNNTINVAHALAVAYHDGTRRLYVLTDDPLGFVYQVSTDNFSVLSSHALGVQGFALSVSNDGKRVYVVAAGAAAANDYQLHVLDVTRPGLPLVQPNPIDIPNSNPGAPVPAVLPAPDDQLIAMVGPQGSLLLWATDIDTQPNPAAATQVVQFGANQQSMVLGTDGTRAYAGGAGNQIQAVVIATRLLTPVNILPAAANVTAIAVAQSVNGDLLAIVDNAASKLYLANPATPTLIGTVPLQHPPTGLVVSPDFHWAYVVEQDAGVSYLEPVDLFSLQVGVNVVPAAPLQIGVNSRVPEISSSGRTLFVPYTGNLANATDGGVAIVGVKESDCCGKAWKSLEGCPSCDTLNCIVLATIKNFVVSDTFQDTPEDQPVDPVADTANHIARIDNHTGRRLLPSTSTLAEIIQCLCAEGAGTKGTKGDPGLPGPKGDQGPKGDSGQNGNPGKDGQGLETGLTRINALSWVHNNPKGNNLIQITGPAAGTEGIVIGFTGPIQFAPVSQAGNQKFPNRIDTHVFQVLAEEPNQPNLLVCRCPVVGTVVPVEITRTDPNNPSLITGAQQVALANPTAIAFLFSEAVPPLGRSQELWVRLCCEFVVDVNGKAVDGAFLRMQLPTGDYLGKLPNAPAPDPFGLQGTLFQSWFHVLR